MKWRIIINMTKLLQEITPLHDTCVLIYNFSERNSMIADDLWTTQTSEKHTQELVFRIFIHLTQYSKL